ncbi:hypothetical protein IAT40_002301 [Kwoniella sp. CBS 6097]
MIHRRSSARLCIAQASFSIAHNHNISESQPGQPASSRFGADSHTSSNANFRSSEARKAKGKARHARSPTPSPLTSCPPSPNPNRLKTPHQQPTQGQQTLVHQGSAKVEEQEHQVKQRVQGDLQLDYLEAHRSHVHSRPPSSSPLSSAPSEPDPEPNPDPGPSLFPVPVITQDQQSTTAFHRNTNSTKFPSGVVNKPLSDPLGPCLPRQPEPPDITAQVRAYTPVILRIPARTVPGSTNQNQANSASGPKLSLSSAQLKSDLTSKPPPQTNHKSQRPLRPLRPPRRISKRKRSLSPASSLTSISTASFIPSHIRKMAPRKTTKAKAKIIQSESEDEFDARVPSAEVEGSGDADDHGFTDSELTPPPPTSQEVRSAQPQPQGKGKTNPKPKPKVKAAPIAPAPSEDLPKAAKQAKGSEAARGQDEKMDMSEPVVEPKGKAAASGVKNKGKGKKSASSSAATSQRPTPALDLNADAGPSTSAERSASPSKKITLKLNVASSARQTPVETRTETPLDEEEDHVGGQIVAGDEGAAGAAGAAGSEAEVQPPKKSGRQKKTKSSKAPTPVHDHVLDDVTESKKRKSASLEPTPGHANEVGAANGTPEEEGAVKKLKLSVKSQLEGEPITAKQQKGKKAKKGDVQAGEEDKGETLKVTIPTKGKGKAKRPVMEKDEEERSNEDEDEEKSVVKPKKKAKRIAGDEDEDTTASIKVKSKKDQSLPDTAPTIDQLPPKSPKKKNIQQSGSSPERANQTKSSPTRPVKPLKSKKPRRSEPVSDESDSDEVSPKTKAGLSEKVKQREKEKDKEKEGGLARSKSTPNLTNAPEGSAQKKTLPKKQPAPRPSAGGAGTGTGTPAQPNKSSGGPMSLLGNTLALLQGTGTTTGTPKGKDGKKDKETKKETPRAVRKGGWAEEWVLTAEQRKEFEATRTEREAERKKRDQWLVDPVNLQEAKDTYRVDSMQSRTIEVPGSMGIRTEGMASQAIRSLLGF